MTCLFLTLLHVVPTSPPPSIVHFIPLNYISNHHPYTLSPFKPINHTPRLPSGCPLPTLCLPFAYPLHTLHCLCTIPTLSPPPYLCQNCGDELLVVSSPFGLVSPAVFRNSVSKGIISNIIRPEGSLLLTDARCLPGSEGGSVWELPAAADAGRHGGSEAAVSLPPVLLGIVAPPLRRADGTTVELNLVIATDTFAAHLERCIPGRLPVCPPRSPHNLYAGELLGNSAVAFGLHAARPSVAMIRVGSSWGTAIVVSDAGHMITCAHVVRPFLEVPSQQTAGVVPGAANGSECECSRGCDRGHGDGGSGGGGCGSGCSDIESDRGSSNGSGNAHRRHRRQASGTAGRCGLSGEPCAGTMAAERPQLKRGYRVQVRFDGATTSQSTGESAAWLPARLLHVCAGTVDAALLVLDQRQPHRTLPLGVRPVRMVSHCECDNAGIGNGVVGGSVGSVGGVRVGGSMARLAPSLVGKTDVTGSMSAGVAAALAPAASGVVAHTICPAHPHAGRSLVVGETVMVLGHALFGPLSNLDASACVGALARCVHLQGRPALLQSSAQVYRGHSGGMLLRVIDDVGGDGGNGGGDGGGMTPRCELIGLVTSNARHSSGDIIPSINFSLPLHILAPMFDAALTGRSRRRRRESGRGSGSGGDGSAERRDGTHDNSNDNYNDSDGGGDHEDSDGGDGGDGSTDDALLQLDRFAVEDEAMHALWQLDDVIDADDSWEYDGHGGSDRTTRVGEGGKTAGGNGQSAAVLDPVAERLAQMRALLPKGAAAAAVEGGGGDGGGAVVARL